MLVAASLGPYDPGELSEPPRGTDACVVSASPSLDLVVVASKLGRDPKRRRHRFDECPPEPFIALLGQRAVVDTGVGCVGRRNESRVAGKLLRTAKPSHVIHLVSQQYRQEGSDPRQAGEPRDDVIALCQLGYEAVRGSNPSAERGQENEIVAQELAIGLGQHEL